MPFPAGTIEIIGPIFRWRPGLTRATFSGALDPVQQLETKVTGSPAFECSWFWAGYVVRLCVAE